MKWLSYILAFVGLLAIPRASIGQNTGPHATIANTTAAARGFENTQAVFVITLDTATAQPATIDYATRDGSAAAGVHYISATGRLNIPANASSATISVTILPQDFQPDRTFDLELSNGSNVTIDASVATATITTRTPTFSTGDTVPGATPGTTFGTFRIPSVNSKGDTAFQTTVATPGGNKTAIFANDQIVASSGDTAPGVSGGTFASFQPPAQNDAGEVAFIAKLSGNLPASRRTALYSNLGGSLEKVIRFGDPAPGVAGSIFTSIHSFAFSDDAVFFTGYFCNHNVTPKIHSYSLCSWTPSAGVKILLREGRKFETRTVSRIDTLLPISSSLGQGRSVRGSLITARLTFSSGASAIVTIDKDGNGTTITQSGDTAPSSAGAKFRAYGRPILNEHSEVAVQGLLTGASGAAAIFHETPASLERAYGIGDPLPGAVGVTISASDAPAWNDSGDIASLVRLTGTGVTTANSKAIVFKKSGLDAITLARLGDQPPGTPPGAKWKAFRSLAIGDDRGPIFVGTLVTGRGGVTTANDTGLWATDSLGNLQAIVRESDSVTVNGVPKTVLTFTALSLVSGSPDQSRTCSANGYVAYLANFTDGTSSVIRLQLP